MNATDVAPTRLASARAEAERVVADLRPGDELALISAGARPRVECGLTEHQKTLRDRIAAIEATDGPTRVLEAVELARGVLADRENPRIIVVTDGAFDRSGELATAADVDIVPVGSASSSNLGITLLQARRSLVDPIGYEILVELSSASDQPARSRLSLELEGRPVDVVPIELGANAKWSKVFVKASAEGGILRARLEPGDSFPADDQAAAVLPRRSVRSVRLVTEGNLFLQMVLRADPLVDLEIAKTPDPATPASTLQVFHKTVPARIPRGDVLVIDPRTNCDLWTIGDLVRDPIVAKLDKDSPLLTHVRLNHVSMPEARKLAFAPGVAGRALVSTIGDEPLYASIERPEGKVLVLTVDIDKGDLPFQTAFPILIADALAWFAGTKGELRESPPTGSIVDFSLPEALAGSAELELRSPNDRPRPIRAASGRALVGPLDAVGIWKLGRPRSADAEAPAPGTETEIPIAANLADSRESDLRVPAGFASAANPRPLGGSGLGPLWRLLAALACAWITFEWYLYQRRWIN
jgi:hypothetical protein